jgi:hypothetical protein
VGGHEAFCHRCLSVCLTTTPAHCTTTDLVDVGWAAAIYAATARHCQHVAAAAAGAGAADGAVCHSVSDGGKPPTSWAARHHHRHCCCCHCCCHCHYSVAAAMLFQTRHAPARHPTTASQASPTRRAQLHQSGCHVHSSRHPRHHSTRPHHPRCQSQTSERLRAQHHVACDCCCVRGADHACAAACCERRATLRPCVHGPAALPLHQQSAAAGEHDQCCAAAASRCAEPPKDLERVCCCCCRRRRAHRCLHGPALGASHVRLLSAVSPLQVHADHGVTALAALRSHAVSYLLGDCYCCRHRAVSLRRVAGRRQRQPQQPPQLLLTSSKLARGSLPLLYLESMMKCGRVKAYSVPAAAAP